MPHVLGSCVAAGRARSRASMCQRFFWWSRRSYLIKTWVDKLSRREGAECRGRQSKMAAAAVGSWLVHIYLIIDFHWLRVLDDGDEMQHQHQRTQE